MKIVLATGNMGKVEEFNNMVQDSEITFIVQSELGVSSVEETGLTFVENALLKARHAVAQTGLPAIADDSGLVVESGFVFNNPNETGRCGCGESFYV